MPVTVNGTVQYFGVGSNYGGHCNVTPVPITTVKNKLLIDGINGLDLGTGIFNASSNCLYTVSSISPTSIGDGIPDILVTQLGSASAITDKFQFLTASNVAVGNEINIALQTVPHVAVCQWKFYNSSAQFVNGSPNNSNCLGTTRNLVMLAFDFADFGITSANIASIKYLRHTLSGDSDQAFTAYNNTSVILLPVTITKFDAKITPNQSVQLTFSVAEQRNNDYFLIQRSTDGNKWENITRISGEGNSFNNMDYHFEDMQPLIGTSYYRLSQFDYDGTETNTRITKVDYNLEDITIFPNPTSYILQVHGDNIDDIRVSSAVGVDLSTQIDINYKSKSQAELIIQRLAIGTYYITINGNSFPFVKSD